MADGDWKVSSKLSQQCHYEDHETCAHWKGLQANVFTSLLGRGPKAILCQCACHGSCPVSPAETIAESEWMSQCECARASAVKNIMGKRRRS